MITRDELHPYVSLVLASTSAPTSGLVDDVLARALDVLKLEGDDQQNTDRQLLTMEQETDDTGLAVGWFTYVDRRPPTWLSPTADVRDETHHLLLVRAATCRGRAGCPTSRTGRRMSATWH